MNLNNLIRKETYKHWGAIGKNSIFPSISLNGFTEFVSQKLKMIDGKKIKIADSDRLFIAVNGKDHSEGNSMLSLIRYEFLEIIFRLALKRYWDSKYFSYF